MIRPASRRASGPTAFSLSCALLAIVGLSEGAPAQPFRMQAAPPGVPSREVQQAFQARIEEQARLLVRDRRVGHLSERERQALLEFVAGNLLIAATHQLGLALLSELSLPALSGAERAADDFAVLAILELGKIHFSDRILMEAAKGWFTRMRRKNTNGTSRYAVAHGLGARRAYRIACLMAGADAARFNALAEDTAMPRQMQRNCGADYDRALRSWEIVLRPHRPGADRPKARIAVSYGAAAGNLAIYAQIFRNLGFLEAIAETAAGQVSWRSPLLMEMRSCGPVDTAWSASTRTLSVCYEMAADFAALYRGSERRSRLFRSD